MIFISAKKKFDYWEVFRRYPNWLRKECYEECLENSLTAEVFLEKEGDLYSECYMELFSKLEAEGKRYCWFFGVT